MNGENGLSARLATTTTTFDAPTTPTLSNLSHAKKNPAPAIKLCVERCRQGHRIDAPRQRRQVEEPHRSVGSKLGAKREMRENR